MEKRKYCAYRVWNRKGVGTFENVEEILRTG